MSNSQDKKYLKSKKSKVTKKRHKIKFFYLFYLLPFYFYQLLGLVACSLVPNRPVSPSSPQPTAKFEGSISVADILLEQVDENGQLRWKVNAKKADYTKDKKIALVTNPEGELFQDGKLVYRISSQQGEIQQDGEKIFLKENVIATDVQSGAVLRGEELEWRPKEDILIVRHNLTGTHKQLDASANEGRVFTRWRRMELLGNVVAKTKKPVLELRTEHVIWEMEQELAFANRPVEIARYQGNTIIERATASQGKVNLKTKIATLSQNARVTLSEPPLDVASEELIWNVPAETVSSQQPVTVLHRQQQLHFRGDHGHLDIKQKICYLYGNIMGVELHRQSQLTSERLTWYIPNKYIEAEGNVVYQQLNPPFNVSGTKAVGKLEEQTVVVTNNKGQVEMEILPEEENW